MESIRYYNHPVPFVDAMAARSARSYPRHSHDQYGIGVMDEGCHRSWSGRGQVEAATGSLICCNPGEVTDGRAVGDKPRTWRMLYFEPEHFQSLSADVLDGRSTEFTFADPVFLSEETRQMFDSAFAHFRSGTLREAMPAETALVKLVARLQRHSSGPAAKETARASITRAKDRIDADPATPLSLADLAAETGLARYRVIRGFATELGLTPHAYIVQRRIQMARRLIRAGHPLAVVAAEAGFYDQPHMTRCFGRQFGVTPSRYAAATTGGCFGAKGHQNVADDGR